MDRLKSNNRKIYNSIFEISIRLLVVLKLIERSKLSIDELLIYDYLILNTFDIGGPASLHAPIPNRGVQLYSKKELLKKSLSFLLSKKLTDVHNEKDGILYTINENGHLLLAYFESEYYHKLVDKTIWVNKIYGNLSRNELNQFVKKNISNWGTEFMADENYNNKV